jgi:hypothetical protein
MILGIVGAAVMIGVVAAIITARRSRRNDLGSVSSAWTTQHNVGYRGGDSSTR